MTEPQPLISGRYRLGAVLGQGGMGQVRQATDTRLDREVAIKLLRADLAGNPDALERFRTEAKAAAGLSHPAIVSVFDFGEQRYAGQDGLRLRAYLVMELVPGDTLHQVLSSGPLAPSRAVQIAAGILHALGHAHRRGVVHRDIKPSNVIIQPSGAVKVMDFGIARLLDQGETMSAAAGMVMGTAYYMSPEQASSTPVDGRSDIYSTGCVLYEMVTGRRPFVGESPVLTVYKHLTETPPPPSTLVAGLPEAFDRVTARAMAKAPADRFATADEFLDALAELLDAASATRPASPSSHPFAPAPPVSNDATAARPPQPGAEGVGHFAPPPPMPSPQATPLPSVPRTPPTPSPSQPAAPPRPMPSAQATPASAVAPAPPTPPPAQPPPARSPYAQPEPSAQATPAPAVVAAPPTPPPAQAPPARPPYAQPEPFAQATPAPAVPRTPPTPPAARSPYAQPEPSAQATPASAVPPAPPPYAPPAPPAAPTHVGRALAQLASSPPAPSRSPVAPPALPPAAARPSPRTSPLPPPLPPPQPPPMRPAQAPPAPPEPPSPPEAAAAQTAPAFRDPRARIATIVVVAVLALAVLAYVMVALWLGRGTADEGQEGLPAPAPQSEMVTEVPGASDNWMV
ncbi:MAG: protein kinase [Bifidobacteriaceae bacterium]|jgi:serine/threonine protein kinase|nr:protein kinase [Bifidobacteriaceae bacterium]